jgi:Ulp1 family protease
LFFLDSLTDTSDELQAEIFEFIQLIYLKHNKGFENLKDWKCVSLHDEIPHQRNNSDCGVFVCAFAEFLSRRTMDFEMPNTKKLRRGIAHEILSKTLLPKFPLLKNFQK